MASIGMMGYQPPHVANHQAGGIDPLNLALIAGQIVAGQHPAGLGADLHHNQLHGAADHDDRNRSIWLSCQDFIVIQGVPAITQYGVYDTCYVGWAFAHGANEAICAEFVLPYDIVSGDSISVYIYWTINVAGAGNVKWLPSILPVASGETLVGGGLGPGTVAKAIPGVNILATNIFGFVTAIDALDIVRLCIQRTGLHGTDTYLDDSILLGACISYSADM